MEKLKVILETKSISDRFIINVRDTKCEEEIYKKIYEYYKKWHIPKVYEFIIINKEGNIITVNESNNSIRRRFNNKLNKKIELRANQFKRDYISKYKIRGWKHVDNKHIKIDIFDTGRIITTLSGLNEKETIEADIDIPTKYSYYFEYKITTDREINNIEIGMMLNKKKNRNILYKINNKKIIIEIDGNENNYIQLMEKIKSGDIISFSIKNNSIIIYKNYITQIIIDDRNMFYDNINIITPIVKVEQPNMQIELKLPTIDYLRDNDVGYYDFDVESCISFINTLDKETQHLQMIYDNEYKKSYINKIIPQLKYKNDYEWYNKNIHLYLYEKGVYTSLENNVRLKYKFNENDDNIIEFKVENITSSIMFGIENDNGIDLIFDPLNKKINLNNDYLNRYDDVINIGDVITIYYSKTKNILDIYINYIKSETLNIKWDSFNNFIIVLLNKYDRINVIENNKSIEDYIKLTPTYNIMWTNKNMNGFNLIDPLTIKSNDSNQNKQARIKDIYSSGRRYIEITAEDIIGNIYIYFGRNEYEFPNVSMNIEKIEKITYGVLLDFDNNLVELYINNIKVFEENNGVLKPDYVYIHTHYKFKGTLKINPDSDAIYADSLFLYS